MQTSSIDSSKTNEFGSMKLVQLANKAARHAGHHRRHRPHHHLEMRGLVSEHLYRLLILPYSCKHPSE